MNFHLLPNSIYFLDLKLLSREFIMYHLNYIMFYNNPEFLHFHIDHVENERSLLVSDDVIDMFIPHFHGNEFQIYKGIHITNTNPYINESGLVQRISHSFSNENIPILYITTYKSNFVLFHSDYLSRVESIIDLKINK